MVAVATGTLVVVNVIRGWGTVIFMMIALGRVVSFMVVWWGVVGFMVGNRALGSCVRITLSVSLGPRFFRL